MANDKVTLAHGAGGKVSQELMEQVILPAYGNPVLNTLHDGALVNMKGEVAFTTDSYVVQPLFFAGGNIGKLAVCGTVNDLSMTGAIPRYLSVGMIIEEGFPIKDLQTIVSTMKKMADEAGVVIATGDTKVVEKGRGDRLYINTAGIGYLKVPGLSPKAIRNGDVVILSGTAGDHGTAVMLARSGMMQGTLQSDCAPLNGLCNAIFAAGGAVRVLRDPTRGGVATTLNEFVEGSDLGIMLEESAVPVRKEVRAACDMLGLDPLYCANGSATRS